MTLLKALALCAILAASPALAAQPDAHKAHHPGGGQSSAPPAAAPDAKPSSAHNCPMMDNASGKSGMPAMGSGDMMSGGGGMHCKHAKPGGSHAHHRRHATTSSSH
jgi:hypothetical protein